MSLSGIGFSITSQKRCFIRKEGFMNLEKKGKKEEDVNYNI
jgi:hypothetical protein